MKKTMLLLGLIMLLVLAGCGKSTDAAVPKDFSFALTWNCYGVSSYDSETGVLVKTTDATHPEDYVTECRLSEEDLREIYDLLSDLNAGSYPKEYDPGNGLSKPSMTLILTVRENGKEKTIRAENIGMHFESKDKKGQKFLSACESIIMTLTETPEWKALPAYERLYE